MRSLPFIVCCAAAVLIACDGEVSDSEGAGPSAATPDGGMQVTPDGAISTPDSGLPDSGTMVSRDAGADTGTGEVDSGAHDDDAAIEETVDPDPDAGPMIGDGPPEVRFVGRVDLSDPNAPRFAWSGAGLIARFMGTSVSIDLGGGQEYTVLIDGALRPKLVPGNGETLIANNLSADTHVIEVYRRTEASQGESEFNGFTFEGGELLAPMLPSARRIEVIGDSITCGYGNEGADETCPFTPQTENHYQTYGAIAARAVNAEVSTIAWSGRGMVCNYGDDASSCTNPLPSVYDRTLPNRDDSSWDFSSRPPQVVIINLGTNDFSTDSDPSEAEFTGAYTSFLLHVRSKYPDALILCTCGPLLYGAELDMLRMFIENAVDATGDDNIDTFEIPSQSADDGLGCDYHPSITTHEKMADLVIAELQAHLGW